MRDELGIALGLRQQAHDRLTRRLEGLGDEEYFWEPAPGCWSVRSDGTGSFVAEWELLRDPPPLTTIAARMWHLGASPWKLPVLTRDFVVEHQFGRPYYPEGRHPRQACGTATDAIESLNRNMARWAEHYESVSEDDLNRPLGTPAGPYGEDPYYGLLLHLVDEYLHHSAEVALMRDLYEAIGNKP